MKINDIYEVTIINEDMEGNGIARIDNFVIFIFGALKNAKVLIKIAELNKRFAKGKIVNIIIKSPKRNKILCPIYDKCGGCNFLHTSYENERKIKKDGVDSVISEISSDNFSETIKKDLSDCNIFVDGYPNLSLIYSLA